MLKFICYPKCTTCQKARKWLDENNIEYEFRDITTENPTLEELTAWYKLSGLPLRKFFICINTAFGITFVNIAVQTSVAAFFTSPPGIPHCHILTSLNFDFLTVRKVGIWSINHNTYLFHQNQQSTFHHESF